MTNRHGLHPDSSQPSQLDSHALHADASSPYGRLNLGLKVGDDPDQVLRNRKILAEVCGLDSIIFMDQVHSNRIVEAGEANESPCDGIFLERETHQGRLGLGVQVADCVPLVLTHPTVIAAVHIGREGLVKGMTEAAITKLGSIVDLSQVEAVIGPSICGDCYPLSEEVFKECVERYPSCVFDPHEYKVDVAAGVTSILEASGITWRWFSGRRECVSCDPTYFSYRRDVVTGRQAMIVSW